MKKDLLPGLKFTHTFAVSALKTVPALYPEAPEFADMPPVFATGFMVGFLEWACIRAIQPYLDWPNEQTLGTHIHVSHQAATPVGMTVTAHVELLSVQGRKLLFKLEVHDDVDVIAQGTHERHLILREWFDARMAAKAAQYKP